MTTTALQSKPMSRLTRGYIICLIGTVLWSSTAIFIRHLTETYRMPPLVLAFWRDLILSVVLAAAFAIFNSKIMRLERRHWLFILFFGFILSLFNGFWTISVALNGAAVSTVLAYSSGAFTAILGWRLFGEKLGRAKIIAVILSLLGCAFVSGAVDPAAWRVNPLGIITGLISGLAFAGYSLMGKEASHRSINPWTTLIYSFGVAAVFLLAYSQVPGWLPGASPVPSLLWLGAATVGWVVLILLALGPTVGGYGLYTVSLTYLPASVANLIATLEPAMTAALAFLLLGERFTAPQWIGSTLIIAGVVLLRLYER